MEDLQSTVTEGFDHLERDWRLAELSQIEVRKFPYGTVLLLEFSIHIDDQVIKATGMANWKRDLVPGSKLYTWIWRLLGRALVQGETINFAQLVGKSAWALTETQAVKNRLQNRVLDIRGIDEGPPDSKDS